MMTTNTLSMEQEMMGRLPGIPPEDDPELDDLKWKPMNTQVGGAHYKKLKIQPMRYSMENKLDPIQHTVIKYVTRFRDKGGVQDLEKAKHCIDMLIQYELTGNLE